MERRKFIRLSAGALAALGLPIPGVNEVSSFSSIITIGNMPDPNVISGVITQTGNIDDEFHVITDADGISLADLYSYLKYEWQKSNDLMPLPEFDGVVYWRDFSESYNPAKRKSK